jgi:phage baseplate assembly protein W
MKSIKVPFSFDGGRVGFTADRSTMVEQKIANVLVTSEGERVMNPSYGASTSRLLFDITVPMEFADYRVDAIQDLKRYVSGAVILDIAVDNSFYSQTGEPTTAVVNAIYRLPLGSLQVAQVEIAAPGQLTEDSII